MNWQILTAISVITFSVSVLLRRQLLHEDKSDPIAYVIVFQGLVGLITLTYALIQGFHAPDFGKYWFAILGTTLLYAAGNVSSTGAFKRVEASVFSILFATSAIWTMIGGAILFNDQLTFKQVVGVILVFLSVLILVERKGTFKLDSGIWLGLLTGMLFGLATVGWAYVGRHADVPTWTALSFLGPALVVLLIKPKAVLKMKPFMSGTVLSRMLLLSVVYGVCALASLFAFRDGNVSVVAVLLQASIIVTTLLGIMFLHEREKLWRKSIAAVACFCAVVLIV